MAEDSTPSTAETFLNIGKNGGALPKVEEKKSIDFFILFLGNHMSVTITMLLITLGAWMMEGRLCPSGSVPLNYLFIQHTILNITHILALCRDKTYRK